MPQNKRKRWISRTPVGRLGFANYGSIKHFCERHGIEIPVKKVRDFMAGVEREQYDWAKLEKQRGVEIKSILYNEKTANIPVAAVANLFGIPAQYVKRKAADLTVRISGRRYFPKANIKAAVNRVRDCLEDIYIHLATRNFGRDTQGETA